MSLHRTLRLGFICITVLCVNSLDAPPGAGQLLPDVPGSPPEAPCMIDDPWVWEDFGGPIPCEDPVGDTVPTSPDSGLQDRESGASVVVTWAQMQAFESTQPGSTARQPHVPGELPDWCEAGASGAMSPLQGGCSLGTSPTPPVLGLRFLGAIRPETAQDVPPDGTGPPDTMGAIGPRHFLKVINGNVSIFDKATGRRMSQRSLNTLFGALNPVENVFDPRVLFDQHSTRWIVAALNPSGPGNYIFLAVSLTDDPTGAWFLNSYRGPAFRLVADFPTLGVDARAIYVGIDLANELWAIEKAPLIAQPPRRGRKKVWTANCHGPLFSVTTLQPAHTYGDPGVEYVIQTQGSDNLEIYKVIGVFDPICPTSTLVRAGTVALPSSFSNPPNAPALGSTTAIDTGGAPYLQMAVYRDGSLWTCHGVDQDGRAALRWYQIDVTTTTPTLVQCGTVADASLHYYYPVLIPFP